MTHIVVSESLGDQFLEQLRADHEVVYGPDLYSDRSRLLASVAGAEAIAVRNRTWVDQEFVDAAPMLRVIGRLGVGLDNIDLDACSRAGILVKPAIGANALPVAEYVMQAMLTLLRPVHTMTESILAGRWPIVSRENLGTEAAGKTMALLGFGSVARHVARCAKAFDMQVVAHDPYIPVDDQLWSQATRVSFEELLTQADVLSVHAPLTSETFKLIGAEALARRKKSAILINTSRGGLVDEREVASALRNRDIAGAALDVFDVEPLTQEGASLFASLDNLLLTPHMAGNTTESVDRVAAVTVASVLEALRN